MIKTMEYLAMSRPVVEFDLPEHRFRAGDTSPYARPGFERHLAECSIELMDDQDLQVELE